MNLRKLWKKATLKQQCYLADTPHDYSPVEVRGKNFYVTGCMCQAGMSDAIARVDALDRSHQAWLDAQPKSNEERIAIALESIAREMEQRVKEEKRGGTCYDVFDHVWVNTFGGVSTCAECGMQKVEGDFDPVEYFKEMYSEEDDDN